MRFAPILAVVLAACAPRMRPYDGPPPVARLADSVPWATESGEGVLHRVEVRVGGRVTTIPGVLAWQEPGVAAGGWVRGIAYEEDAPVFAYEYDARTGRTRHFKLPADALRVSDPIVAPDGGHLAYVAHAGPGLGRAVVRSWPGERAVLRSRAVQVPATDVSGNVVNWRSADSVEIFVEIGERANESWQRVVGSVRERRMAIDTVHQAPWQ